MKKKKPKEVLSQVACYLTEIEHNTLSKIDDHYLTIVQTIQTTTK